MSTLFPDFFVDFTPQPGAPGFDFSTFNTSFLTEPGDPDSLFPSFSFSFGPSTGPLGPFGTSPVTPEEELGWWDWLWNIVKSVPGGIAKGAEFVFRNVNLPPIVIGGGGEPVFGPPLPGGTPTTTGTRPKVTVAGSGTTADPFRIVSADGVVSGAGLFGGIGTNTLMIGALVGLTLLVMSTGKSER